MVSKSSGRLALFTPPRIQPWGPLGLGALILAFSGCAGTSPAPTPGPTPTPGATPSGHSTEALLTLYDQVRVSGLEDRRFDQ